MKKLSITYARLLNLYIFKYQTVFSARFDEQDEDNQVLNETELFNYLNIIHNLTQTDIDKIDVRSPLEHRIQQQEMKDSGCRFERVNSMIIIFHKTCEIYGRSYVKIVLRSNAILNIETNDKFCFLWWRIASLHPCNNNHPNSVSNYKQYFNELNNQGFDFNIGFKCSDVHKIEEINTLSINIFELTFYEDQNKWRHKLLPIEVSKNDSDRVIGSLIYKNHYALIKKINDF